RRLVGPARRHAGIDDDPPRHRRQRNRKTSTLKTRVGEGEIGRGRDPTAIVELVSPLSHFPPHALVFKPASGLEAAPWQPLQTAWFQVARASCPFASGPISKRAVSATRDASTGSSKTRSVCNITGSRKKSTRSCKCSMASRASIKSLSGLRKI